jgi:hypothetical protein
MSHEIHNHRKLIITDPDGVSILRSGPKGSRRSNLPILCADASYLAVLPKRRNISIFLREP